MSKVEKILAVREAQYGNALNNFEKIGKVWGALLEIDPIEPHKVALLMDALKTVRLFRNPYHEDSWIDKEGYVQLGKDIANNEP